MTTIYRVRIESHKDLKFFQELGYDEAHFETTEGALAYINAINEGLHESVQYNFSVTSIQVHSDKDISDAIKKQNQWLTGGATQGEC